MKNNKDVKINAKEVIVQTNTKKKNRPRKRKVNSESNYQLDAPPQGIQTGLSNLAPGPQRNRFKSKSNAVAFASSTSEYDPLSQQSEQFFELFSDPNGEHNNSLDAIRVPDGALPISAGGSFRAMTTIEFPGQDDGEEVLTSQTYSMLFLQFPFLRSLTFILVKTRGGEFGTPEMDLFVDAFAKIPVKEAIMYPMWDKISNDFYFTAVDTSALRNIIPPNNDGQSGVIDAWRMTSQGLAVYFNTPDLLNQGTVAAMRYPLDKSEKSLELVDEVLGAPEYLSAYYSVISGSVSWVLNFNTNPNFPVYTGTAAGLPAVPPFTVVNAFSNASNTFSTVVGNTLRYVATVIGNSTTITLLNITTNQSITILAALGPVTGSSGSSSIRFYRTSGRSTERVLEHSVTVVGIPPVTHADMMQQNAKTFVNLAKETNGVYLTGTIMQPIFNVTLASSYNRILLVTQTAQLTSGDINPEIGWFDTVDTNFSVGIINFQGIPLVCKPMLKICRGIEMVPSPNSILGAFSMGCPPVQNEVVDMCKAFVELQPHGYPPNWNGLGILYGKALQVVKALPALLRSGRNMSREIQKVVETETYDSNKDVLEHLLSTGFKRLFRAN